MKGYIKTIRAELNDAEAEIRKVGDLFHIIQDSIRLQNMSYVETGMSILYYRSYYRSSDRDEIKQRLLIFDKPPS